LFIHLSSFIGAIASIILAIPKSEFRIRIVLAHFLFLFMFHFLAINSAVKEPSMERNWEQQSGSEQYVFIMLIYVLGSQFTAGTTNIHLSRIFF